MGRTLSSVCSYDFTETEDTLFVHLYIGSELKKNVNGTDVSVRMTSEFPWNGKVTLQADSADTPFTLALRIPGWCTSYQVSLLGAAHNPISGSEAITGLDASEYTIKNGYLYITRRWDASETLTLDFPMEIQVWNANPNVREDIGRAAVTRGPITYCLEEADNGRDLHLLTLDWNAPAQVRDFTVCGEPVKEILMQGFKEDKEKEAPQRLYRPVQAAEKSPVTLHFIPYYTWANRGENEMSVWVRV